MRFFPLPIPTVSFLTLHRSKTLKFKDAPKLFLKGGEKCVGETFETSPCYLH